MSQPKPEFSWPESRNTEAFLPRIPDPFDFARRGRTMEGRLTAKGFERLAEDLRPEGMEAEIVVQVRGWRQEAHDAEQGEACFLELAVRGRIVLGCQRCLEDVALDLDLSRRFLLVPEGQPLPDNDLVDDLEDEDFDPVHASRNLDVVELVEDEILLGLPAFPTHADCQVPGGRDGADLASPFAALAKLKRGG